MLTENRPTALTNSTRVINPVVYGIYLFLGNEPVFKGGITTFSMPVNATYPLPIKLNIALIIRYTCLMIFFPTEVCQAEA